MPLYEYRCRECGSEFEELVSVHATESPSCPFCSYEKTEKMISLFSSSGSNSGSLSCSQSGFS